MKKTCDICGIEFTFEAKTKISGINRKFCDKCRENKIKSCKAKYYNENKSDKSKKKKSCLKKCIEESTKIGISYGEYMASKH